jgi:hypothetical protein
MKNFKLYNNDALIAMLIYHIVRKNKSIDIGIIAAILPILTNDYLVDSILNHSERFANIISLHPDQLRNYSSQFNDVLLLLIEAISILMDVGLIDLVGELVVLRLTDNILEETNSNRLKKMSKAADTLLADLYGKRICDIYKTLRILL